MTHEEYIKRRDEILKNLWVDGRDDLIDNSAQPFNKSINKYGTAIDALVLAVINNDINKDVFDEMDDTGAWPYYDDYSANAYDFINGYNKSKSEQRSIVKGGE